MQARSRDGNAVISVQDNGIGIAPELLPQLFEMFSQATSALDRSEGGLGIGLSLARGLVALHGGTIEARSAGLGHGQRVRRDAAGRAQSAARREADASRGRAARRRGRKPLRVLVADDNRDSADSSATLLEHRRATTCASPTRARRAATRRRVRAAASRCSTSACPT